MKSFIYALTIVTTLGLTVAGCSRISPKLAETEPTEANSGYVKAITVYKSPTCGCCSLWEEHLRKAGFEVTSKPTDDLAAIRKRFNVPEGMQSCHTAVIDGYVIEGHVPADDIKKLLSERPDVVGLAAPGMPPKSPGMQPESEKPADFDVLSFDRQGNAKVFTSY